MAKKLGKMTPSSQPSIAKCCAEIGHPFESRPAGRLPPSGGGNSKTLIPVKAFRPRWTYTPTMSQTPHIDVPPAKILSLPAETQFAPEGIVSRTLWQNSETRVILFGFAAGQELTEHTSTQHAFVQILSGECKFVLGSEPHDLKAGDWFQMPPNLPHSVHATRQFSMLLTLSKAKA